MQRTRCLVTLCLRPKTVGMPMSLTGVRTRRWVASRCGPLGMRMSAFHHLRCFHRSSSTMEGPTTPSSAAVVRAAPPSPATGIPSSLEQQLQSLTEEDQTLIRQALQSGSAPSSQCSSQMGGPGIGPAHGEMVAAFTCGQCDFRMVKRFSKHAYTKGIVVVECPHCHVKHLLADNLGWWEGEATTIEDILRARGEEFVHIGGGDYQVVVEDPETVDTGVAKETGTPLPPPPSASS